MEYGLFQFLSITLAFLRKHRQQGPLRWIWFFLKAVSTAGSALQLRFRTAALHIPAQIRPARAGGDRIPVYSSGWLFNCGQPVAVEVLLDDPQHFFGVHFSP